MDDMNNTPDMNPQQPNTEPQPDVNQQPYTQPQVPPQQPYQAPQQSYQAPQQPPMYQAPVPPPPYTGMPNRDKKGVAIAGMILGIVSLVCFCIPWLSIVCAIIGLILGIVGMKSTTGKGMAIAGVVCSVVALALAIIILVIAGSAIGGLFNYLEDYGYYYY